MSLQEIMKVGKVKESLLFHITQRTFLALVFFFFITTNGEYETVKN